MSLFVLNLALKKKSKLKCQHCQAIELAQTIVGEQDAEVQNTMWGNNPVCHTSFARSH